MPILMLALLSLGAFGLIGILLFTAMILEHRMQHHKPAQASGPHAGHLPLIKH